MKKYYSTVTGKIYDTEEDLNIAEEKVLKAREERENAEKKRKTEQAARIKELDEAFEEWQNAGYKCDKLLESYKKDYGCVYSNAWNKLLDSLFS